MKLQMLASLAIASLAASGSATATVVSTFDVDADGWTCSIASDCSWSPAGGNPGGYLHFDDQTEGETFAVAPAKFLSDWSAFDENGSISFDQSIFVFGTGSANPYTIRISGPGGSAEWTGHTPAGATPWTTIVAPISEGAWNLESGAWASLLADVTDLRIRIEMVPNIGGPQDSGGLENINLVPEPSTALLLALGLPGVAVLRQRRGTRSERSG